MFFMTLFFELRKYFLFEKALSVLSVDFVLFAAGASSARRCAKIGKFLPDNHFRVISGSSLSRQIAESFCYQHGFTFKPVGRKRTR
jgi:hypothetical protein